MSVCWKLPAGLKLLYFLQLLVKQVSLKKMCNQRNAGFSAVPVYYPTLTHVHMANKHNVNHHQSDDSGQAKLLDVLSRSSLSKIT